MSIATYPLLRTAELVACLVDYGIQVTSDDIDRPTSAKVVPLYVWFLSQLTQLTLEDVMVAAQLQLDQMEDQELYREAVYVGALWAVLQANQVMQWATLEDFSVRDIRDPQAPRVRRILSALLNFYLFEQDQIPKLTVLEEQTEELARAEHDAERRLVELENALSKKRQELEQNAALAAEIEKENATTREHLLEKRTIATNLANKIEIDKRERSTLQQRAELLQQTLSSHEGELVRLRSRIVQSPTRVKQTLNDLAKNVAAMKEDILQAEARSRDHASRISALKKYEIDLASLIRAVEEWESELVKSNEVQMKLTKILEDRDARHDELRELDMRSQQLARRIQAAVEQKERHAKQAESKKMALQKRMNELQEAHGALMAQRQDVDEEAAKRHRAIALKEREILELVRAAESDIAQGEAAYRDLKAEVLAYSAKQADYFPHVT